MHMNKDLKEIEDIKEWHKYIENLPSNQSFIKCEYAKVMSETIRVGSIIYKTGDIICSFCPGLASYALGGLQVSDACNSLREFNQSDGTLEATCNKRSAYAEGKISIKIINKL